jgi:hypothetical protein
MAGELRRLLSGSGEATRPIQDRRQEILKYIANHPGSTPYEIAKNVLGDGIKWSSSVFRHIRKMETIGGVKFLLVTKDQESINHVSLTEDGRIMAENEGLLLPSDRIETFIHEFNKQLDQPLTVEETKTIRELLSSKVLEALSEIAQSSKPLDLIPSPELSLLDAIWFYDAETNLHFDDIKQGIISKRLYEVFPQFRNYPKKIVEREAKKLLKKIDLDAIFQEHLAIIPIAKKHGVEAEMNKLAGFLRIIATEDRGKIAAENLRRGYELYAFRYGTSIQVAIAQKLMLLQQGGPRESRGR